jgi:hypothetical protein
MSRLSILPVLCFAAVLAAQSNSARPPAATGGEPADTLILTLPGPPAVPQPAVASEPSESDHRPLLRRAPKPILPAEFERDSGFFCQKLIGAWTERDAYNLFGDPLRSRDSFDGRHNPDGRVYAYSDPTGRYRAIELDFAKASGLLRTVFVYPWKLTWTDARRTWSGKVQSAEANKGRTFYSFVDRRLDVLVDASGNVISLGLY